MADDEETTLFHKFFVYVAGFWLLVAGFIYVVNNYWDLILFVISAFIGVAMLWALYPWIIKYINESSRRELEEQERFEKNKFDHEAWERKYAVEKEAKIRRDIADKLETERKEQELVNKIRVEKEISEEKLAIISALRAFD